ncbi:reverse transcriptase domain-containing protein [Tanacetum coccineum]|uniref:Reverse transcriptase domain-containing protein n=1 Tax=Tanacetum coccineum TaxID=301880 RepID=A0ABQ4Y976_9ASTR
MILKEILFYHEDCLIVINSDLNVPPSPVCELNVPEKIKSSCEDPPNLELKDLPSHLEYAFLEVAENSPPTTFLGLENAPSSETRGKGKLRKNIPSRTLGLVYFRSDDNAPMVCDFANYHAGFLRSIRMSLTKYHRVHSVQDCYGKRHVIYRLSWSTKLHKAYWALKHTNFDIKTAGDHRKVQLNELRDHAYENSLIYKEKTKRIHDSKIKNRVFNVGDRVLLFNSRLKIFSGKLKTRWSGPFTVTQVFPYGTIELSQNSRPNFKVNGHRLKHYFGGDVPQLDCPDCEDSRALSFVFHPQEFHILSFILGIQKRIIQEKEQKKSKTTNQSTSGWKGQAKVKTMKKEKYNLRGRKMPNLKLCDNGTEFKNNDMNQFCGMKGIKREFSVARTPQQNGVTERKNRILIEAARTMLADSFLPTTFWAALIIFSTACYSTDDKDADEVPDKGDDDVSQRNGQEKEGRASNKEDDQHVQDFRAELDSLLVQQKEGYANNTNRDSTASPSVSTARPSINTASENINTGSPNINTASPIPNDSSMQSLENTGIFDDAYDDREVGAEADLNNLETTMNVSPIPTTRIHKDHPKDQIIGDINSATQTRRMTKISEEHAMVSYIKKQRRTNHKDYQNCLFACFLSQIEPKKVIQALTDPSWIEAMQEELLQFKLQKVWTLVDFPKGKRPIGTK